MIQAIALAQAATNALNRMPDTSGTPLAERLVGLLGIVVLLAIAYLMSYDRRRIPWRLVGAGLALQATFGLIVLKTAPGRGFFQLVGSAVTRVLGFVDAGASFVFGNLIYLTVPVGMLDATGSVAPTPGLAAQTGAVFAFRVLPTIVFVSSLTAVLYYMGLLQIVVKGIAWVMQKTLRTSGAETLSASGNIFLGQTEAPLLIRPFVAKMTPSELLTVMVGGFATVAGGVLAAYVAMLQDYFPAIAGHLLAASVMNAPAGLLLSKIIRPETDVPETKDTLTINVPRTTTSVLESAAEGAGVGVQLAINVAGMLIAFIALVAMLNFGLGWVGGAFGHPELSLQVILGALLRPLAWVMGVPWADTQYVGSLIGLKVSLNEFVAYLQFAKDLSSGAVHIHPRSAIILAYALLGFANFSSIAIQIGGIGGLAPERRGEIARFGLRAMVAGNLAAYMSACWAGIFS
jgi:CNT family concentrative nucleoside transporter